MVLFVIIITFLLCILKCLPFFLTHLMASFSLAFNCPLAHFFKLVHLQCPKGWEPNSSVHQNSHLTLVEGDDAKEGLLEKH